MEEIYKEEFYKAIHSYFKKRVSTAEVAEDLTQEVYMKVTSRALPDDLKSVKAWMFTICRNTLIDFYRKKKEVYELEIEKIAAEGEESENEFASCLLTFMKTLPTDEYELLNAIEVENIKQKDLAVQMDIPYTTLKSKVQKARKNLFKQFMNCCDVERDGRGHPFKCIPRKK